MSKLSDTLQRSLDNKKGIHHPENGETPAVDKKTKTAATPVINNKPPTRSAGRGR